MHAADLQKILWKADHAAVLVSPQIMERVIRDDCKLPTISFGVPHAKSYVTDRQMLYRHAEQADLELEPDQLLPDTVILLSRPPAEELASQEKSSVLLKYWRRIFHARIHIALTSSDEPGGISPATARERITPGSVNESSGINSGTARERLTLNSPNEAGGITSATARERLTLNSPDEPGAISPSAVRDRIALNTRDETGGISAATVRQRIDEIGRTEFEEIRSVLQEDDYLPDDADDKTAYIEFAAVFLELYYFAGTLLPNFFPGIRDRERVVRLLTRDVDARAVFERTRLTNAPDPVAPRDSRTESEDLYQNLLSSALKAVRQDNIVRAAILHMRAARIAPAALTLRTREKANANLRSLTDRLIPALGLEAKEAEEWYCYMVRLLDKADQGHRPSEARLLEDLQQVCIDFERDIYTLDLVEWFMSMGKRPIKRPLPSLRVVRITRHLRNALGRLGAVRLSDADRQEFGRLLQSALNRSEENVRARFRPVLATALQDVGLEPANPPEKAAFEKVVAELLDRILTLGFFTFADLRDTISRNQLKLPDLRDPQEFLRGDALIRLNNRLAALLDGVYRPGEMYMRLLEWGTAWNFGTKVGRALTTYVTIPLGGAFLILAALGFLLNEFSHYQPHPWIRTAAQVLLGPWHAMGGHSSAPSPPPTSGLPEQAPPPEGPAALIDLTDYPLLVWHGLLLGSVSLFLLALMHSQRFRNRVTQFLSSTWHVVRLVAWDWPLRIVPIDALHRFVGSWLFQIVWWFILQPLAVSAVLWWRWPTLTESAVSLGLSYLIVLIVINSRIGRGTAQVTWEVGLTASAKLREGLLKGVVRFTIRVFKHVIDFIEFVLFTVEEWLRFRSGDSWTSMIVRVILGVIWFPVAYVARFYMVVLIEPGINPIKFPISSLAAKFVYPLILAVQLQQTLVDYFQPVLGGVLANAVVGSTIWLLPDVFGFLFWEIKENWSLYRANRPTNLRAVSVGPHGETLKGLLQPGFHSGTVPRAYGRLRKAERLASKSGDWHAARAARHELEEIASGVKRFVARELVGLLRQSRSWHGTPIEVGLVDLATNRIRFELVQPEHPGHPVVIEIERAGNRWLVAGIRSTGWLDRLGAEPMRAFTTVLAGWYKLAGVDLVREQIRANLPPPAVTFDIVPVGLVVWLPTRPASATYDLTDTTLPTVVPVGSAAGDLAPIDPNKIVFSRIPLSWSQWMACWDRDQSGRGNPGLPELGEQLVWLPAPPATDPSAPPDLTSGQSTTKVGGLAV